MSDHDSALKLIREARPKVRSEYLDLLSKYAGTPFENDPAILKLRNWLDEAERLTGSP